MSEAPHGSLTFAHRSKSGALCTISIDLEKVRNGTFRPDFIWHGRSHKPRELIAWVTEIFQVVAARTGIPSCMCFLAISGELRLGFSVPAKGRDGSHAKMNPPRIRCPPLFSR